MKGDMWQTQENTGLKALQPDHLTELISIEKGELIL